jgi:hypothetical protein
MASLTKYTNPCSGNSGGNVKLYLAIAADVTSFTLGSGVSTYNTVTMPTGKKFVDFDFEEENCTFRINGEGAKGATKFTHEIEFAMGKLSNVARTAVMEIVENSPCGIIGIIKDANDQQWVVGYDQKDLKSRPLRMQTATGDTKTDLLDPSALVILLSTAPAGNREMARIFTGTVPTT